jgi:hypothetical protein
VAANDFTDIVERALYQARRSTSNAHAVARAGELANEWHRSLCDSGNDWTFLKRRGPFTATVGTDEYSFSTLEGASHLNIATGALREIIALTNTSDDGGRPLKRLGVVEFERATGGSGDGDATGTPVWYTIQNRTLRLAPGPDAADVFDLDYRLQPAAQLSGVQTFLVPESWIPRLAIPYIATRLLWSDGSRDALALADRLDVKYAEDLKDFTQIWSSEDEEIAFRSPTFSDDLDVIDIDYFSSFEG